ncbi:MAG: fibronectin type III domain-containing protein, partial [Propionibacteriaceae bacterium]|nr:fibronectin type III domain-containing protein [Propionibacteriaceae bacterium]
MCEASHSSATSGMVSPHAPLNVAVSAREDMAVVSWEGQSDATYVVEVSQDEAFTKATQTKADTTTAAIADLVPATHYYARVRSAAPLGQLSAFSEVVTFTTAEPGYILAPPVVKLSMDGFSTLKATWKQAAVDKPTYEVSFEPAADADATAQPSASADASA